MATVKDTLGSLPGVTEVDVDFPNRIAKVTVDDQFDQDKALSALDDAGFPAKSK